MRSTSSRARLGRLRGTLRAVLGGVCIALLGCQPTVGGRATTVPGENGPGETTRPEGMQEGNSAGELESRLEAYVNQRKGLVEPAATDTAVCEDLCSLASSICEVKDKLCELSEERAEQADYRQLCRTAQHECNDAEASCINCVESHQNSTQPDPR